MGLNAFQLYIMAYKHRPIVNVAIPTSYKSIDSSFNVHNPSILSCDSRSYVPGTPFESNNFYCIVRIESIVSAILRFLRSRVVLVCLMFVKNNFVTYGIMINPVPAVSCICSLKYRQYLFLGVYEYASGSSLCPPLEFVAVKQIADNHRLQSGSGSLLYYFSSSYFQTMTATKDYDRQNFLVNMLI